MTHRFSIDSIVNIEQVNVSSFVYLYIEAVTWKCYVRKVFLKISQNSY